MASKMDEAWAKLAETERKRDNALTAISLGYFDIEANFGTLARAFSVADAARDLAIKDMLRLRADELARIADLPYVAPVPLNDALPSAGGR